MTEKAEIIQLTKHIGETPLECIYRFKESHPEYRETKMTYLGRLDPMAEGLLLVLAGNTREKSKYLDLDKTYEFEVLWGFETDTYDILGMVTNIGSQPQKLDFKMARLLEKIREKKMQAYPPYSSRTVGGKSLFMWARENRIEEIEIPTRSIKIFSIDHIHTRLVEGRDILREILDKVTLVKGDFRQKQIQAKWKSALSAKAGEMLLISKFKADVSSGTYIRSLAHEMGHILDTCAIAYSIKRTRVGRTYIRYEFPTVSR